MRFNTLSHDEKLDLQKDILDLIEKLGGLNHFYKLLEDIRGVRQHPLLNKTGKFHFTNGTITWGKEIYKDKIDAIFEVLKVVQDENILEVSNEKLKKQITNSIRTLGKLVFIIETSDAKIEIEPFKSIDDNEVRLNHLFQIIFFDSINNTKKILKYK